MNRKEFLSTALLSVVSLSTVGQVINLKGKPTGNCQTTSDILGPYYRPNSPTRSDLTFEGIKGSLLNISGKIIENDCETPISNVSIEIWHCNIDGDYDNNSNKFLHRGKQFSNDKGEYAFNTILPGKYLNGSNHRPSHIHFRITSKSTKELVSQIYFANDIDIENDRWASSKKAESRILNIKPESDGSLSISFDIYLESK